MKTKPVPAERIARFCTIPSRPARSQAEYDFRDGLGFYNRPSDDMEIRRSIGRVLHVSDDPREIP